jgi:hypothetical protein
MTAMSNCRDVKGLIRDPSVEQCGTNRYYDGLPKEKNQELHS